MNFLGKRKQRPRCEARMFKGEVYLPSLRAGPTEWISLSSVFRSQRGERSDVITLTKPRETIAEKYVDPCDRDTIRSNCLAHYDHSRQTTDYTGMKRKLFTSKKIRKHDYPCPRDAETRAMRLHVRFLRRDGIQRSFLFLRRNVSASSVVSFFEPRLWIYADTSDLSFRRFTSLWRLLLLPRNFIYYDS